MNILDTSACTDTNILFLKSGHFNFMQEGYNGGFNAVTQAMIGPAYSASKVYITSGLTKTTSGGFDTYAAGVVFFAGELYASSGGTFTAGSVIVMNLLVVPYTAFADPTQFEDGVDREVCNQRNTQLVVGASGSGTLSGTTASDYTAAIRIRSFATTGLSLLSGWVNTGGTKYPASYKYVDGNEVKLSGVIDKGGGYTGPITIVQLPLTLTKEVVLNTFVDDGATLTPIRMLIDTTGLVTVDGAATPAQITLDGLSFRIS